MNQADEFSSDAQDLVAGRDSSAQIRFDPDRDDLVSRQHLKITATPGVPNSYQLVDLQSRNGTFLNRQRVYGAIRLNHNDVVQLGAGGPEFRFELNPPPLPTPGGALGSGPREAKATRESWMPEPSTPSRPVGRGTVERMLGDVFTRVRRDRRRSLVIGALAIVGLGVMTAFLWVYLSRSRAELQNTLATTQQKNEASQQHLEEEVKKAPEAIEEAKKQVQKLEAQLRDSNNRNSANQKELMEALEAARRQTAALSRAVEEQKAQAAKAAAAQAAQAAQTAQTAPAAQPPQAVQSAQPVQPDGADSRPRPISTGYDGALIIAQEKLDRGEASAAFEIAQRLVQQDPSRWGAYALAGQAAAKLGDTRLAGDLYLRAIARAQGEDKSRLEQELRVIQEKAGK
jgi:hypothetical protein